MFDLPPDLVDLDLIYLSWGTICWAPDLNHLATGIATRLRPGGVRDAATPPPFQAFVWPVSDVVMSLLQAGLTLNSFTESPAPDLYADLGPIAVHLPAYYVIKATEPDVSHETFRPIGL